MKVEYLKELPENVTPERCQGRPAKYIIAIKPIIDESEKIVSIMFDTKKEVRTAYNSIYIYLKRNSLKNKVNLLIDNNTLYVFRK